MNTSLVSTQKHTHTFMQTLHPQPDVKLPLRLSKAVCQLSEAVHLSGITTLAPASGTIEVGSKTVSTPSVTIPLLPICWFKFPTVHIVEGSTALLNRHLKHVCTPPSTMMIVSNVELVVMLIHCCELPVGGKGLQNDVLKKKTKVHTSKLSLQLNTHTMCALSWRS